MKIIIVGAGEVGLSIAQMLDDEGHNVVVIDGQAERLAKISEQMDVQTVEGNGANPRVLAEAGAKSADVLIAVTRQDEVNMVACEMAHALFQIPKKIARVREEGYLELENSPLYTPHNVPIDVIISPEREVAEHLYRTMLVPGAFDVSPIGNGAALVVGCYVSDKAPLLGQRLKSWNREAMPFHLLAVRRDGRLIMPTGSDHLEAGDEVYLVVAKDDLPKVTPLLVENEKPLQDVLVMGGGRVGVNLVQLLEEGGQRVRVLDDDPARCAVLAEKVAHATVLHGDALSRQLMVQENVRKMDAVVACTSDSAVNVLASVMVKQMGVPKVMTLVNRSSFIPLAESMGLSKIMPPKQITISSILRHIRPRQVRSVHAMRDSTGEILELLVRADAPVAGSHLRDIVLPPDTMLGCVVKPDGRVVMNDGNAIIQAQDHVVLFATLEKLADVEAMF
ncbi:MAG: Trk system potassium transporter TrkA [Pseudomonadaceae bacterium]|nr:Trk system potassium transporter TrkA [Pseudomonadaceae bacterium]